MDVHQKQDMLYKSNFLKFIVLLLFIFKNLLISYCFFFFFKILNSDADCLITGLIFQFGCVSAVFFWTALSLDLYFQITNRNISRKYDLYYFIGVNLISLIFTFVPVISKSYGYGDFALG